MTDEPDAWGPDRPRRQIGRRSPDDAPQGAEVGTTQDDHSALSVADHPPVDPREEKFDEIQVAALFFIGIVFLLFTTVAYFTISIRDNIGQYSNYALGGGLAIALTAIGAGFIVWAKKLLPHEPAIQDRHAFNSTPEEEKAAEDTFLAGVDDLGLGRYKLLRRTLIGALALFPLPLVVMLRDLGPLPGGQLLATGAATGWKKGSRLVDLDTKIPVKLGDVSIGGIKTVMPEGFTTADDFALAPTMLIRFADGEIESDKELNWGVNGHVAYSKICTHAGCPASLYEHQTRRVLCPCHQSQFNVLEGAKPVFGPATRSLPQLPLGVEIVDGKQYFVAKGDFPEAIGPAFWERP